MFILICILCLLAGVGVGWGWRSLRCTCKGDLDPRTIERFKAMKRQLDGIDPIGKDSTNGKRDDR